MNRPLRKLIAFSAAAAMLANIPLMTSSAKYVAEQITDKEFESLVEYPDRNVYIENGTPKEFATGQQLVVVDKDGSTKLISLDEAITSGICYATTTMGIFDFIMPTTSDYGFNFMDPNIRFGNASGTMIVGGNKGNKLLDADGGVIAEYHAIKRLNDTYFTVYDIDRKVGVIDVSGKVVIELTDTAENIFLCPDGKKFFIDGKEGDYFTDLSGKTISPVYEEAKEYVRDNHYNHCYWAAYDDNFYNEPDYNYTLSKYYRIKKDGKYAIIDSDDFKQVTDYFDTLDFKSWSNFDWYDDYFIKGTDQLYDKDGNAIPDQFSYTYFDEALNRLGQFSDAENNIKDYSHATVYYRDENGEDINLHNPGDFKGAKVEFLLHRSEEGSYDKLLNSDMETLLEGDSISTSHFYVSVRKDGSSVYYNGKLEKLGEYDSFNQIGNCYVAASGDKCVIYNNFLDEVIDDNAPADMANLKWVSYNDYKANITVNYYYIKDGDSVKIFDTALKPVDTVEVTEDQNYLVSSDYRVFVYDKEYDTPQPAGDCFYLTKEGESGKVVDINGDLVAEIPSDYNLIPGAGVFYNQVGSELSFYNYKGEFIKKFDSYGEFRPTTSTDYTYVINGKDEESGKTASYIYNAKSNEIVYSQVGKYNNVERIGNEYVRTIVYPEDMAADSTDGGNYLWSNDDGYKIGLDKIDGTQLIAPMADITVDVEEHCYAGSANQNERDKTIDTIYSDGTSPNRSVGPYDLPATGNNDSGYFVINAVYVPIKDFAPDFAKDNSFGIAVKTQFGNYIIINDGKWGMADADGTVICEPKYTRIYEFADGIAFAEETEPVTATVKEEHYNGETNTYETTDVEKTGKIIKLGLVSKDGAEILPPAQADCTLPIEMPEKTGIYRYEDTFYVQKGKTTFDRFTYQSTFEGNDYIYKGSYYYNDFNDKYKYDSAIPCGDLYIVRKNGLTGVVSSANEVVVPIEYANVLYVPSTEKMVVLKQSKKMKDLVADPRFSTPITDLDDGSKIINLMTSDGKIKAYQIRETEDPIPFGDPNNDSKIDAKDSSLILVAYSKASTGDDDGLTAEQRAAADVNSDSKVDAKDASTILAYYALVSTSAGDVPTLKDFAAPKEK
ncbi:hypothetical protein SAMN02910353_02234 [Ruminococcus sp. YRD2003]|uniref:WG repeat-containing protein n=1 Tax=Ruminococcus sp. YRD2003 TaxID=1452313 RepID=UPI0008C0DB92|nr:hypothetical protein SAMN02910353_02234 [Ruminococcus flavefaciens]